MLKHDTPLPPAKREYRYACCVCGVDVSREPRFINDKAYCERHLEVALGLG